MLLRKAGITGSATLKNLASNLSVADFEGKEASSSALDGSLEKLGVTAGL